MAILLNLVKTRIHLFDFAVSISEVAQVIFTFSSCSYNVHSGLCAGLAMFAVRSVSAVQFCGSGMLASDTQNLLRSAYSPGNLLQQTATTGQRLCRMVSGRQMNCGHVVMLALLPASVCDNSAKNQFW